MSHVIIFNNTELPIFGNDYHVEFKDPITGIVFSSVNQYVAYYTAIENGDYKLAQKILKKKYNNVAKIPKKFNMKHLERGCYYKFSQNGYLRNILLMTRNYALGFVSNDKELGTGCYTKYISEWTGKNLLGAALMNTREKLKCF